MILLIAATVLYHNRDRMSTPCGKITWSRAPPVRGDGRGATHFTKPPHRRADGRPGRQTASVSELLPTPPVGAGADGCPRKAGASLPLTTPDPLHPCPRIGWGTGRNQTSGTREARARESRPTCGETRDSRPTPPPQRRAAKEGEATEEPRGATATVERVGGGTRTRPQLPPKNAAPSCRPAAIGEGAAAARRAQRASARRAGASGRARFFYYLIQCMLFCHTYGYD